jgi:exopolysaccharide biosynthesis polyprenyl glycosylphosphotransferase
VNVIDQATIAPGAVVYQELETLVDERTLEILEKRRHNGIPRRRGWLVRRMLLVADLIGLAFAFLVAQLLFGPEGAPSDHVGPRTEYLLFLVTLPGWVVVAKLYNLYDHDEERTDHSSVDDVRGVFHLVTVGAWIVFAGAWLTGLADPNIAKLVTFWALAVGLITLGRVAARAFCRTRIAYLQNTVIVGAGDVGQTIARKLLQHPEYGINLVGFVDAEPRERADDLEHLTVLGYPEQLPEIVELLDVERVIIAFSRESHEKTLDLIRLLNGRDLQIDIVPRLFELVGPSIGIHTVEGLPLVGLPPMKLSRSSRLLKRTFDVALAGFGLFMLIPVFLLTAAAIKLDSRGPVFYRHDRRGRGGSKFKMTKFRTMHVGAEDDRASVAHMNEVDGPLFKVKKGRDPRVTRVGAFLRRTSIDELPQLWNVVRGDMSLVGPRPFVVYEADQITGWASRRLDMTPGITGLWQMLGRNDIAFEEMCRLDYLYVTNWSLWWDLKILFQTIPVVFSGKGAY